MPGCKQDPENTGAGMGSRGFPGAVCTQGPDPAGCVAELSRLKIPSVVLFQTEED